MGGRGHKGKLPIYKYDEKDGLTGQKENFL
jgi:hypothetical protein